MSNVETMADSVGASGANNLADIQLLKEHLVALGFDWLIVDDVVDQALLDAINLVQSIKSGRDRVSGDGRVDVSRGRSDSTFNWLRAENAPVWTSMPEAFSGEGFFNFELSDLADHHDFGVTWMTDTIVAAGWFYSDNYLFHNPNAALLTVNDVSLAHGGPTGSHSGHEAGIACDIRLPHLGGSAGGFTYRDTVYDRNAMRGMLQSIRVQPLVDRIIFNDPALVREGLCVADRPGITVHDNHAHFELRPFMPIVDYPLPLVELCEQAIILFNGNPTSDSAEFALTENGFQAYLESAAVNHFAAAEMIDPHESAVAASHGYTQFLPPHTWWPFGAALALLAAILRDEVGEAITMRNWWRPRSYNDDKQVGGKPDSEHIGGYAVDLDYASASARELAEIYLRDLRVQEPWLELSLGLGNLSTHVGLFSPKRSRIWHYKSHPDHPSNQA